MAANALLALGIITIALAAPLRAADYKAEPGPFAVTVERGSWIDRARNDREVPWKLYLPKVDAPAPVVLWSHGLGGSRDGAEYLGRHLASHGYAAFHIQHAGSDSVVAKRGRKVLFDAARDPDVSLQRFLDVPFAVAQIGALHKVGPWAGRFDVERIGMSGHSFGAVTTMVAAGQAVGGEAMQFGVPEIDGAFVMSPSPPRNLQTDRAYTGIAVPIFHVTGTRDSALFGDNMQPADRRIPFDRIQRVDQYLLVLKDGVHMTFSGRRDQSYPALERHHALIRMAAVAFWDAVLKDDPVAREWLDHGGLAGALGAEGTLETKGADGTVEIKRASR